ncbi:MAG: cadherin domain-containing protein [Planctomycetes bacterium]|nr:cadherin domain-containing protein [Planctomycetota bacterium]
MASDTTTLNGLPVGVAAVAPPWNWEQSAAGGSAAGGSASGGIGSGVGTIALSDTFKLHSRPTATKTIFLDFDGFTARFTPWRPNGEIVSPPYDFDRNPNSFSDRELLEIQATWQRVASDFAPFDVNVTTEDPGEDALVFTGGTDDRWGMRVVITTNDEPARGTGGVAFLNSFRSGFNRAGASDTPCYAFNISPESTAQTISHEVGHTLGLNHDGDRSQQGVAGEYYFGHGTGETSWGPIMGAGFGRNLTQWSSGGYLNSTNSEDDLSIIVKPNNGFGFIPDEFGNSQGTASELSGPIDANSRSVISQLGRIERNNDFDFFRIQVGSGLLELTIDPYISQVWTKKPDGSFVSSLERSQFIEGTNLDIEARLLDESGNVVAVSNPANSLKAEFRLDLSPGIYFLSIDGVGFGNPLVAPPSGYTDYGSLGKYLISGSFPVAFGIAVTSSVLTYTENDPPKPITDTAKVIDNFPGSYATGSLLIGINPAAGATDVISLNLTGSPDLTQVGSQLSFRGTSIGNLVKLSESSFRVDFNSRTTKESIEAIVQAIRFEAKGDTPDTFARSIQITLTKGSARGSTNLQLNVISVNDRPLALVAPMNDINEDDLNSAGTKVDVLIDRGVVDLDITKAKAIVLTGVPASPGKWQFDVGRGWTDLGPVSATSGLVLGPTAGLRFVPSKDFFGAVPALRYLALDPTYVGLTSSATRSVFIDTRTIIAPDSVSVTSGEIRQTVRPVNDPPVAREPFPSESVIQDKLLQFTLPANLFNDVDDTVLTLSAFTGPGVPLPKWLTFNAASRTFVGTPSNEDVGVRQFIVRATDPAGAFGDLPVTIDIINVNDKPTSIQVVGNPVPENVMGAFVGKLIAIDPDPNDSVTWSIADNPGNRFEIRGNELFLSTIFSFDFETDRSAKVTIRATDNGSPPLFLDQEITVNVQDVNEFSPDLRPIFFSVAETASSGTEVGKVVATDGDTANSIRYRFFGPAPAQFNISDDGHLTVKEGAKLDFETTPNYQFFVQAFDDGNPLLSTWASVSVSVLNANEHAPDIVTNTLVISENYPIGVPVAQVIATDRDKQPVAFSLPSSETRFSINSATGEISLNRAGLLDFERSTTESLTVIVSDVGLPGIRTTQKVITISVANANEPPTSASLERNKVLANVAGIDLGRITVQDPDDRPGSIPTSYSITSLDERFQVVAGNLRLQSGKSFKDSDPQFVMVSLLLNDIAGGTTHRADVQIEILPNPTPWRNTTRPFDVDLDGSVGPLDVLSVINVINSGPSTLPMPREGNTLTSAFVDVDGDGQVTPLDVLAIVNIINGNSSGGQNEGAGEGEGSRNISSRMSSVDEYFAQFDAESDPSIVRARRSARSRSN